MPVQPSTSDHADHARRTAREAESNWLDVRTFASIHASSEDAKHPVVRAFSAEAAGEWRAAEPGMQVIEVRFREPRDLTRIRLVFEDTRERRTQQFTVSWSSRRGESHGEVVRQQFNFSPTGATCEIEDYRVELLGVDALQIRITPDISSRPVFASLAECRLA